MIWTQVLYEANLTVDHLKPCKIVFFDDSGHNFDFYCKDVLNVLVSFGKSHCENPPNREFLPFTDTQKKLVHHPIVKNSKHGGEFRFCMRSGCGVTVQTLRLLLDFTQNPSNNQTVILDWDCTVTCMEHIPCCFLDVYNAMNEQDRESILLNQAFGSKERRELLFQLLTQLAKQKQICILTAQTDGKWISQLLSTIFNIQDVPVIGCTERNMTTKGSYIKNLINI